MFRHCFVFIYQLCFWNIKEYQRMNKIINCWIYKNLRLRLLLLSISLISINASGQKNKCGEILIPVIDGDWWEIASNPDLELYTSEKQQPVDFAIWKAADGTWQLWSCIRNTKCGGKTRLFYLWEGESLTDTDWKQMGIAMEADTLLGETLDRKSVV